MRSRAAVGIDNDLATGQARITVWPADFEAARRVDVVFGFGQQVGGEDFGDDLLHIGVEFGFVFAFVIAFAVLRRDDDGRRGDGNAAFVTQRHLTLGIGFEERRCPRMTVFGHALQDLVRIVKRGGH